MRSLWWKRFVKLQSCYSKNALMKGRSHLTEMLVCNVFGYLFSANVTNVCTTALLKKLVNDFPIKEANIASEATYLQVILLQPSVFINGFLQNGLGHFLITAFVMASSTLFLPLVSCLDSTWSQRIPG